MIKQLALATLLATSPNIQKTNNYTYSNQYTIGWLAEDWNIITGANNYTEAYRVHTSTILDTSIFTISGLFIEEFESEDAYAEPEAFNCYQNTLQIYRLQVKATENAGLIYN